MATWSGCAPEPEALTVDPAKAYIDARTVLLQAADDQEATTRSHAVEALAASLGADAGAVFAQCLADDNPMVRFAAALAIGDVKYKPALETLEKMARHKKDEPARAEPDKRVFCAVIYALYRLGNDDHAGELGKLLFDKEREVRMDAALVMGKMGEPSAIGPLNTLVSNEQDDGVKIQATESLALLGDSRSTEVIEAYTKGYFLDLRLVAIPAMAKVGGRRAPRALKDLVHPRQPVRVRVAAAGGLAQLGQVDPTGYQLALRSLREPKVVLSEASKKSSRVADTDAGSLRCLAALSLGWMKQEQAVNDLHPLLRHKDGPVRVSAALSILRLLRRYRPAAGAAKRPASQPATQPAAKAPKPKPRQKMPKLHSAGAKD